jgi:hypothetical protein
MPSRAIKIEAAFHPGDTINREHPIEWRHQPGLPASRRALVPTRLGAQR